MRPKTGRSMVVRTVVPPMILQRIQHHSEVTGHSVSALIRTLLIREYQTKTKDTDTN